MSDAIIVLLIAAVPIAIIVCGTAGTNDSNCHKADTDRAYLQSQPMSSVHEINHFVCGGYKIVKDGEYAFLQFTHGKAPIDQFMLDDFEARRLSLIKRAQRNVDKPGMRNLLHTLEGCYDK